MNLLQYIQGRRKGKEAHRIERKAMTDPFLADALEGFDSVDGNHAEAIRQMREQVKESVSLSECCRIDEEVYHLKQQISELSMLEEVSESSDFIRENRTETVEQMSKKTNKSINLSKRRRMVFGISIAASILLIAGAGLYLMRSDMQMPVLSEHQQFADTIGRPAETDALALANQPDALPEESAKRNISQSVPPPVSDELSLEIVEDDVIIDISTEEKFVETEKVSPAIQEEISVAAKEMNPAMKREKSETVNLKPNDPDVIIHEDTAELEEVVVTGYARQKKITATDAAHTAIPKEPARKDIKDVVPEPVIGKRAYAKYLNRNLIRPTDEECAKAKGTVIVQFKINGEGRPYQLKAVQSLCETADAEAVRLITEGSDWTLGDKEVTVEVKF